MNADDSSAPTDGGATAKALSRRRLLAGAGALAGLVGLEVASLEGAFDHRSGGASARARYDASRAALEKIPSGAIHVGHSTHVIQLGGFRVLTDPWFHDPAFGSLAHAPAPATSADAIGRLDAVLISHDHADHADLRALDQLDKRATVLTATASLAAKVKALGFAAVEVLEPWREWTHDDLRIAATPAVHDVPEVGFVLRRDQHSVYFAGDTALFDGMRAVRERYQPTTAFLPCDGIQIRWEPLQVMGPQEALEAVERLGVTRVFPTHHEAVFSDPIAEHALTKHPVDPVGAFERGLAKRFPAVRYASPQAGVLTAL